MGQLLTGRACGGKGSGLRGRELEAESESATGHWPVGKANKASKSIDCTALRIAMARDSAALVAVARPPSRGYRGQGGRGKRTAEDREANFLISEAIVVASGNGLTAYGTDRMRM